MMQGLNGMMGLMMGYWVLASLLVLIVLGLVAVWLFQHVRSGARAPTSQGGDSFPPAAGRP